MKYGPYPEYRDAGFAWLGRVPAHWEVQKLKHIASSAFSSVDKHSVVGQQPVRLCNYVDVYYNEAITDAIKFMDATASPEEVARFRLRKGDVMITKDSESWDDIAVAAHVEDELDTVLCGYHLALVRPKSGRVEGRFLHRAFGARGINDQFRVGATGITRYGLGKHSLDVGVFPLPPLNEQQAIATVLDRETAKIDALVAKKERLVELLQEKRTALLTQAVTKGLDPSVRMKESGVDWLGPIPTQWTVTPAMRLTALGRPIMYGIVLPGPNVQDGVPIVKGGDVAPGGLRRDSLDRTTFEIEAGYVRSRLRGGDIVYAIRGSIGAAELVPDELEGANLTQDAARISPASSFNAVWLLFALRSRPVFAQLEGRATGATIRGINIRDLKRACIPVPPRIEQDAIAAFLDCETNKIDALVGKVLEAIEHLKEYRTALISAAVTGKIDVRGQAVDPAPQSE